MVRVRIRVIFGTWIMPRFNVRFRVWVRFRIGYGLDLSIVLGTELRLGLVLHLKLLSVLDIGLGVVYY
jgi:hypothetical protein